MEKVTVRDLTPEELLELKGEYNNYTPQGRMHASIEEITDEEVFDHYAGMSFNREEFVCNGAKVPYIPVQALSHEELGELKERYTAWLLRDKNLSEAQIKERAATIPDEKIISHYAGVQFWHDEFDCNRPKEE